MTDAKDTSELRVALAAILGQLLFGNMVKGTVAPGVDDEILGKVSAAETEKIPIAQAKAAEIAHTMSSAFLAVEPFVRGIADVLIQLTAPVATTVLKSLGDARNDSAQPLNVVITQALSDLLGVDFAPGDVPVGGSLAANTARARSIGDKLHSVLLAEFAPDGEVTPESGERAARAFTGFNVNFGVTSAFISIVAEMFSLGQFKEFRELGVEVAENLGLGRMHRSAIKPLIDNTIAKPYDRQLRARYRQDKLSESQFVKALHRGRLTEEEIRSELAQKGFKDAYIDEILSEFTLHLSDSELERLVRHGVIPQEDAVKEMQDDGWPAAKAALKLQAIELARTDASVQAILAEYRSLVRERFMDTETFHTLVEQMPLSNEQKTWEIRLAGASLDFPHLRVTQAELTSLLEHGIVDLTYADEWAKGKGYADADALNLELLYFAKEKDKAAKAAAAKARADRAAAAAAAKAAGKKPPTTPVGQPGG